MKNKFIILTLLFLLFPVSVSANREKVIFEKCTDGDTFKAIINKTVKSIRLLAVDTPETYGKEEPYGKEAKDFTCNLVENAKTIELEYDENSDKLDKYDRVLAWVWIDGELLQEELIKEGLAEVAYLYGDYKYTEKLKTEEKIAKENEINLWKKDNENSDEPEIKFTLIHYFIASILMFPVFFITSSKRKTISDLINRNITNKHFKVILIIIYSFSIYPGLFDIIAFTGKKINIKKLLFK